MRKVFSKGEEFNMLVVTADNYGANGFHLRRAYEEIYLVTMNDLAIGYIVCHKTNDLNTKCYFQEADGSRVFYSFSPEAVFENVCNHLKTRKSKEIKI